MSAFRVSISRRSSLLGPAAPRGAIVLLLWSSAGGRSAARLSGLDGVSVRRPNMRTRCTERFFVQAKTSGDGLVGSFFGCAFLHTNSDFCIRRAPGHRKSREIVMLRSLGSSAQAASLRRAGVGLLRRWYRPDLDPIVPSPDRVLHAVPRKSSELGTIHSREMRAAGRLPVVLQGDGLPFVNLSVAREALMPFLRRTHYQRELLTLEVEGGEKVRVLTQEVQYDDLKRFNVKHVNFRRWPRDPLRHPVKLPVPIIFVNEETHPTIKTGGYTHDIFSDTGLKCLVRDPENIPRFLVADMRRADGMDLRMEHLTVPPGVTIRPNARTLQNGGNFLVGRVKRVRG